MKLRTLLENLNDPVRIIAQRFGLPPEAAKDIVSTPVAELKQRDAYMAPSNGEEPVTDAPRLPMGSAKIGMYGDPMNSYVEFLTLMDPNQIVPTEHEQDIRRHPTFDRYVSWYKAGHVPPPVFVAQSDKGDGRWFTTNRRRTLAARDAGIKQIPAWVSMHNKETNLPLKYGDVMRAYAELAKAS